MTTIISKAVTKANPRGRREVVIFVLFMFVIYNTNVTVSGESGIELARFCVTLPAMTSLWLCGHVKRGYSLVEVVLAIGLFGVALLGITALFIGGLGLSFQNSESYQAVQLGQQIIERTHAPVMISSVARSFDGRTPDSAVAGFPPAPYPSVRLGEQEYKFLVRTLPKSGTPNLYELRVEVYASSGNKAVVETEIFQP